MPSIRSSAALAALLVTAGLLAGCQNPSSDTSDPSGAEGDAPVEQTEDGGDDTVDPTEGPRLALHIEGLQDNLIPFAYGDYCGGDFVQQQGGFVITPQGTPPYEGFPPTVPNILVFDLDTDDPQWDTRWTTTDSPYTATTFYAGGSFVPKYAANGQFIGGIGEGTLYTDYPDGSHDEVPDFITISVTREGPEPANCDDPGQREYTYF